MHERVLKLWFAKKLWNRQNLSKSCQNLIKNLNNEIPVTVNLLNDQFLISLPVSLKKKNS